MHEKKRIEIIIEKMAARRATKILSQAGAKGYTILPAMEGAGEQPRWRRDADISGSRDMVVIVSIVDKEIATHALEKLENLLGDQIGVLNIASVEVLRPDLF